MNTTEQLQFTSREDFREWLSKHCLSVQGIWLTFGKKGGPKTLSASEALEEALCFGWIDGQMKSIDEKVYIKYFAQRRKESKWSDKNKSLIAVLEKQGKMTDHGRAKVEAAKKRGTWNAPKGPQFNEKHIQILSEILKHTEPAYSNFMAMSPSVKTTYAAVYLSAVSEETRTRRLAKIIERLNNNLKPM